MFDHGRAPNFDINVETKEWGIAEKTILAYRGIRTRSVRIKIQYPYRWAKESTP